MTGEVTAILHRFEEGDSQAPGHLVELLYPELKRIAERRMHAERTDHTLQPTALVNEFFLQMARQAPLSCRSRGQFLAAASEAMRRLLIDHARAKRSEKRGGAVVHVHLDELGDTSGSREVDLVEMGELLDELTGADPRASRVVDMHCFGGLSHKEIGEVLGVDERTVKRDWQYARAWLRSRMDKKAHVG